MRTNVFRLLAMNIDNLIQFPKTAPEELINPIRGTYKLAIGGILADWFDTISEIVEGIEKFGVSYLVVNPEKLELLKLEIEWFLKEYNEKEYFTNSLANLCHALQWETDKVRKALLKMPEVDKALRYYYTFFGGSNETKNRRNIA